MNVVPDKNMFVEDSVFVELKMEIQDFIENDINDDCLKDFKSQFQIMFNYLISSYINVSNTQRNINDTNEKITRNLRNKAELEKNIEEDQERILSQKNEFENLYLKIDNAKTEEVDKDKMIKGLNDEIIRLNQLKDKDNLVNFKPSELEHKEKLKAEEEDLEAKYELMFYNRQKLQKHLADLIEKKVESEKLSNNLDLEKDKFYLERTKLIEEYESKINNKSDIDKQFSMMKEENKLVKEKISKEEQEIKKLHDQILAINAKIDEIENANSKISKKIKNYLKTKPKLLKDINEAVNKADEINSQIVEYKNITLDLDKQIADLKKEKDEFEKTKKKFDQKIDELVMGAVKLNELRDITKSKIQDAEKLIDEEKIKYAALKEEMNKNQKKDNNEKKVLEAMTNQLASLHHESVFIENTIRRAMNEAVAIKKEIQMKENEKELIEAEKNMYAKQSSDAQMEFYQAKERLKNLNEAINDLKEKNVAAEQKLKQQKKIYEAVKADCNRFDKKFQEAKNEIKDISDDKSKKSQKYQFLKIELNYKQKVLSDLQNEFSIQETDLKNDEDTKKALKKDIEKIKISIETYQDSNNKLNKTISLSEHDYINQKKDFQVVFNERDFLGQQLIQRNNEIKSLYEKIQVLQGELVKMNKEYEAKLTEIESLKTNRDFLLEEFVKTENIIKNIFELKVTKIKQEKELLLTKNKLRSLEDQTKRHLNIHRWTKLEYSDPEKFELITQINSLQRRLIAKTEEVNNKEELIQEKEKLYIKLKGIVARQSGVDMVESLKNYQKIIKEENEKLKKMSKEVKHLSLTIRNYELEIKKLDEKILGLKNQFITNMKKNSNYGSNPNEDISEDRLGSTGMGMENDEN